MRKLVMYSNVAAVAVGWVLLYIAPSWGAVFGAAGWTAAWFYHYTTCQFIKDLIDAGILEVDDE